jgi:hypothetical protein
MRNGSWHPHLLCKISLELTMKCHGIGKLLWDVFTDVGALEVKWTSCINMWANKILATFLVTKLFSYQRPHNMTGGHWRTSSLYHSAVPQLFSPRSGDFYKNKNEILGFQNSCAIGIDFILVEVQIKETELQKNNTLKDAFTEGNYNKFMVAHPIVPSPSQPQRRKC